MTKKQKSLIFILITILLISCIGAGFTIVKLGGDSGNKPNDQVITNSDTRPVSGKTMNCYDYVTELMAKDYLVQKDDTAQFVRGPQDQFLVDLSTMTIKVKDSGDTYAAGYTLTLREDLTYIQSYRLGDEFVTEHRSAMIETLGTNQVSISPLLNNSKWPGWLEQWDADIKASGCKIDASGNLESLKSQTTKNTGALEREYVKNEVLQNYEDFVVEGKVFEDYENYFEYNTPAELDQKYFDDNRKTKETEYVYATFVPDDQYACAVYYECTLDKCMDDPWYNEVGITETEFGHGGIYESYNGIENVLHATYTTPCGTATTEAPSWVQKIDTEYEITEISNEYIDKTGGIYVYYKSGNDTPFGDGYGESVMMYKDYTNALLTNTLESDMNPQMINDFFLYLTPWLAKADLSMSVMYFDNGVGGKLAYEYQGESFESTYTDSWSNRNAARFEDVKTSFPHVFGIDVPGGLGEEFGEYYTMAGSYYMIMEQALQYQSNHAKTINESILENNVLVDKTGAHTREQVKYTDDFLYNFAIPYNWDWQKDNGLYDAYIEKYDFNKKYAEPTKVEEGVVVDLVVEAE